MTANPLSAIRTGSIAALEARSSHSGIGCVVLQRHATRRPRALLMATLMFTVTMMSGCSEAVSPGNAQAVMPATSQRIEPAGVFVEARPVRPAPPATGALQRVPITDPSGFGQPMTAMTIEVPEGWRAAGQVRWDLSVECVSNNVGVQWSATSADALQAVSILPRLTWQVSSATVVPMYPCPAAPMDSVRAYLQSLVRSARPGARELSYRDRPDMVAERAAFQGQPQGNARMWTEAGEMLISYPLQGIEMRESIVVAVNFSEMRDPMVGRSLSASAEDGIALRAPDGQLDFALLERIRKSVRTERVWGEQLLAFSKQKIQAISSRQATEINTWHQRRMNEITTAGILERGRIRMDAIQAVGRINNQIAANTSATNDTIHAGRIDAIQEVQPWRDPSTGQQVDLSIHYQHAWQLDDGRQFLTNDPNFDPQRNLGIEGRRLEPAR